MNRFAFGALIGLERKVMPTLWRRVRTDGSYLSAGWNPAAARSASSPVPAVTAFQPS